MSPILSCYTNCYGAAGVWEAISRIREAGLRYAELALRPHSLGGLVIPESAVLTERTDEATAARFAEHLAAHGVQLSGCNIGGADLTMPEGLELAERRLRCAHRWFRCPVAISGAGQPRDASQTQRLYDQLRRLGDLAGELGMTLALETHQGPTQNADAMLALMEAIDHPRVRLNFDTGNIAYYNRDADPVAELRRVAHYVANVHLKDNRGRYEDWFFPALGDGGGVDFAAVRQTLDAVGYAAAYTIEIEGIGGEPEPGLEARQDRVRRSVGYLRACGFLDPDQSEPRATDRT
ncbi:MAG: hypothetical protein KatS3mg108_2960 [Isosphaeraceae bacterium]|jgi:inosose dehydratase|nr:MAG: hypothetical protein KatS3mg108_2960 [Isosphaeraceae bacterium]